MSMGRPIITTNAPGCRETIQPIDGRPIEKTSTEIIQGKNGFLVPVRNVEKLVQAMQQFIDQSELIQRMGNCSREIAVAKYDVHKVNAVILRGMGLI
jgi:glycosyltransferase involved in cell wall biosynthesis